jgi:hypothetical protein
MWFRRTDASITLNNGASFRRAGRFEIVETAKIIAVWADSAGIPHVRFSVRITAPRPMLEEQRTLSLESFRRLYPEPVAAAG